MRATRAVVFAVAVLALAVAPARAAANKEHQQLMAEIRMLQEQQQQLQQLLGELHGHAERRVDEDRRSVGRDAQGDGGPDARRSNGIGENVRVLREKADDTNVRVSIGVAGARGAAAGDLLVAAGAAAAGAGRAGRRADRRHAAGGAGPAAVADPTTDPVPPGVSPQRMYDSVFDDYTAGRYDSRSRDSRAYIQAFPETTKAADAQLNIGMRCTQQGKWTEARGRVPESHHGLPAAPTRCRRRTTSSGRPTSG